MNSNVKTAPTVAPVAAPGADLKNMNSDELRAMLNVLRNNEIDLEDKELATNQKQQTAIVARIRELKANKVAELTKIAEAIKTQGFKVHELFNDSDIVAYATDKGLLTAKATKSPKAPKADGATKVPKASDNNQIFLTVPKQAGGKGPATDWVVRQGRIDEPQNGKSGTPFATIPKAAVALKGVDVTTTEKNLAQHLNKDAANLEYAKSPKGKAELTKIAEFIFKYANKA